MERAPMVVEVGKKKRLANGVEIVASKLKEQIINPSDTARHEATHIVVAGQIRRATIIPSGNALGSTEPVEMTAAAAMAAHAMGHDGTGWDEFLTKFLLRVNPESAASVARAVLANKEEELQAVAEELEEKKTIGQYDVERAYQKAERRRQRIDRAKIVVLRPNGKSEEHELESHHNIVMIPGRLYDVKGKQAA